MSALKWAYGVTTVSSRVDDLLPRTLESLKLAGFDRPRLFVDGAKNDDQRWKKFGLETTFRDPTIRTFGNWILGLAELYIREPNTDRFAMFQDDFVTYRNLRSYLSSCQYPDKGYWNLYTFPSNQGLATCEGWYESNQFGRGAVALVLCGSAVRTLLAHQHMIDRPLDAHRGWRSIDGGIITAFKKAGWKEYVHNPSLVQHTGDFSSMGNVPHKKAISFRGEEFDAMALKK